MPLGNVQCPCRLISGVQAEDEVNGTLSPRSLAKYLNWLFSDSQHMLHWWSQRIHDRVLGYPINWERIRFTSIFMGKTHKIQTDPNAYLRVDVKFFIFWSFKEKKTIRPNGTITQSITHMYMYTYYRQIITIFLQTKSTIWNNLYICFYCYSKHWIEYIFGNVAGTYWRDL